MTFKKWISIEIQILKTNNFKTLTTIKGKNNKKLVEKQKYMHRSTKNETHIKINIQIWNIKLKIIKKWEMWKTSNLKIIIIN